MSERKSLMTRRKAFYLSAAGCASWAYWGEPNLYSITRKEIQLPNLPPSLDGLKIAHLTDFHYRPDSDDSLMQKIIRATNAEEPDIIALTGDFITDDVKVLDPLAKHLHNLTAKHGIYAVMGNHDGWTSNSMRIGGAIRSSTIDFLKNTHTSITIHQETLAIAGTDFVWQGRPDPIATVKGIKRGTPVLALVHEPDFFDSMATVHPIDLQLSGHTHGGQCRVPLIGYAPIKIEWGKKYNYGEFAKGDSKLFVSRGVGTTGPRVRFACRPEIAILTLRAPITS